MCFLPAILYTQLKLITTKRPQLVCPLWSFSYVKLPCPQILLFFKHLHPIGYYIFSDFTRHGIIVRKLHLKNSLILCQ